MNHHCRQTPTARRTNSSFFALLGALSRALLLAILVHLPATQAASLIVDSFDDRSEPAPWYAWVTDGAGSTVALGTTEGYQSAGALRLAYTFDCRVANSNCGQYALAIKGYPDPVGTRGALSVVARMPLAARLLLRIVDAQGQTLQYPIKRPDGAFDASDWFAATVDLALPKEYWGGARSGQIEGGIRSIRFLVTTRTGMAESGQVDIDVVRLLDQMPTTQPLGFAEGEIAIDDFEDRAVVLPWRAWHTAGVGTGLSLAPTAGHQSVRGMRLEYDFACRTVGSNCGQYALAIRSFTEPLPVAPALRFATRSPAAASLMVRLVDGSGQTLQYVVERPPEGFDAEVWTTAIVDLANPESHWGGAATGRLEQGIQSLRVLVSTRSGNVEHGAVEVDDFVLLDTLPAVAPPQVVDGVLTIDDFEDRPVVRPWSVWATSGIGTDASVTSQAGFESARGLRLEYAFDCRVADASCGQYAMAVLTPPQPLPPLAALRFVTRSPLAANLSLRIIDGSGQTLQYRLVRPTTGYDPDAWYLAVADLSAPQAFWGGAASGRIEQEITSVRILVETRSGNAENGAVQIDRVALLTELPMPDAPVAVDGEILIDDFEDRSVVQPWSGWHTAGAGTSAQLSSGAGFSSARGMHLAYGFGCAIKGQSCGEYALATLTLEQPIAAAAALSFMTRSPAHLRLYVRVVDDSGQTLQYRLLRPLAGYDEQTWYRAVAALGSPDQHWGGRDSGQIEGGIRKVQVLASSVAGEEVAGVLEVDRVSLLETLPDPTLSLDGTALAIDDLDLRGTAGPWQVDPGDSLSTGDVRMIAGDDGNALALRYDLACEGGSCGGHVVARLSLPEPVEMGRAIRLRALSPGNVDLALRIIDAAGETLQFLIPRTVEGAREALWYHAHVRLDRPESWWGGDGNGVADGPLQGIAVVARNALSRPADGEVLIDDIMMLADVDTAYALDHAAPRIAPAPLDRIAGERFGVAYHPGTSEAPMDAAAATGLSMARFDVLWTRVERDGSLDFSAYDAIVEGLRARGLRMLLILDYGHPDYDFRSADGIAAFSRFAAAAAQRYAAADVAFEIWNEPDHANYWAGAPDAGEYAALASAAMSAMRARVPDAVISTGGLSYFDFPYLEAMLKSGAADLADAVGVHAYDSPELLAGKWVTAGRLIQEELGTALPIWLTEWGFSLGMAGLGADGAHPDFLARQAQLAARSLLVHWALGAEVSIAYKLNSRADDPLSVEENFALYDWSLAERPLARAIRSFSELAAGRSNGGLLADVPAGLHAMVIEDAEEIVYAVWQSEGGHRARLRLPIAGLLGMTDHLGNAWMPAASSADPGGVSIVLEEAGGPVFIRYAR
ncbi:MAG: cellulase family glycosylhydrolase [Rhodocyclaceae bacterium]|nr:cellulase family glycosylhydrolase [Rhodocyclaceae bacterium]